MKTTILNKEVEKEKTIDWNKNNILVNKDDENIIVLTNGKHDGDYFSATILNHNVENFIGAQSINDLNKNLFKLPNKTITIEFENE